MGYRDSGSDLVTLEPSSGLVLSGGEDRPRPIGEHLRGRKLAAVRAIGEFLGLRTDEGTEVVVSWRNRNGKRHGKPALVCVRYWRTLEPGEPAPKLSAGRTSLAGRTVAELLRVSEALLIRTMDGLEGRIVWLDAAGKSATGVPYLEDVRRAA